MHDILLLKVEVCGHEPWPGKPTLAERFASLEPLVILAYMTRLSSAELRYLCHDTYGRAASL